jgi:glycosyltransferase involved in cell wall biosynthesis
LKNETSHSLRVSVSLGPASYTEDLVQQLANRRVLRRVMRAWPELTVHNCDAAGHLLLWKRVAWYRRLVQLTWAVWTRLPGLRRHRHPQVLLNKIYDRTVSRWVGGADLFLGWSQVSLLSARKARALGAVTALEHPMLHVGLWQDVMRREYEQHGKGTSLFSSLFPDAMVRLMLSEYAEADFVVVPSSVARQSFLERGMPAARVVTVPFGVDAQLFSPDDAAIQRPTFDVLYVGRVELLKGVHYLLEAWRQLNRQDAVLTLAGPVLPEMAPVLERARPHHVRVLGEVPRAELPQLYRKAHVTVFPSVNDGFGMVILEAMACGCPVIASRRSGGPDVIAHRVNGLLVDPGDVADLIGALRWVSDHPEERRTMGQKARTRILEDYTLDQYGQRLIGAYSKMLEGSVKSP